MKIVMVNVGETPKVLDIKDELYVLQEMVGGGYIEVIYPWHDSAALICNDEGKFNGMKANRGLYAEENCFAEKGSLVDVIYGPFFICGTNREEFTDLTPEQIDKYMELFKTPQKVGIVDGHPTMVSA